MVVPPFELLSKPWRQLIPIPLVLRAEWRRMTTESPSALFTLSSIPVTPARSLPRIPGQQGVLVQLSPVMVPSTNVVCGGADPGKRPKIGVGGTPVKANRLRLS